VSASLDLSVFVQNDFGRRGVPVSRSFETWVRAALTGRHRGRAEVNIALFDLGPARDFNLRYRDKDYATNVLSFPYEPAPREKSRLLGDLVLCPPVIAREAADQGKRVRDHYTHLTVHGVLHLIGYDHENKRDALKMEAVERRILAELGIADPYN